MRPIQVTVIAIGVAVMAVGVMMVLGTVQIGAQLSEIDWFVYVMGFGLEIMGGALVVIGLKAWR